MYALKNKVQLIGNLGNAPEIKTIEGGKKMAKFSVATNETYRNAKGEKIWIDHVVVTGNDLGDKSIQMSQAREVTITDNIAGFGFFQRMPRPAVVSGNKTPAGEVPFGLGRRFINDVDPTQTEPTPSPR